MNLSTKTTYTLFGVIFGTLFPLISTLYLIIIGGTLYEIQVLNHNFLIWVIDTAPIVLGVTGFILGTKQELIEQYHKNDINLLQDQIKYRSIKRKEAEKKYETLFNTSQDAIIISNPENIIIDCNNAALELFNVPNKIAFSKLTILNLVPNIQPGGEKSNLFFEKHIKSHYNNYSSNFECLCNDIYGNEFHTDISLSKLELHGKYLLQISIRNISDKKINEAKLLTTLHEVEKFKLALNQHSVVFMTNKNGEITYANEKFCNISKYSQNELIGNHIRILNSDYHGHAFWKIFWDTISTGKIFKGEIRNKAKDGSFYWEDTTIIPIKHNNKITNYMAIKTDITEKRKIMAQLTQNAKTSTLVEMSAGIAHEINNPLAIINGYLSILKNMIVDKKINYETSISIIDKTVSSANRISKIIKGLKTFARDGTQDPYVKNSINQIVEDTITIVEKTILRQGIQFSKPQIDIDLEIECQSTQICQVLVNLLNNSRDAVIDLEEKWIKITLSEDEKNIYLSIIDSGKGIPEGIYKNIMEPFFTTKIAKKGTGLGLSLSKTIIEKHNGTLKLDKLSKNTKFDIILPKFQKVI